MAGTILTSVNKAESETWGQKRIVTIKNGEQ